jgi:hypothetical protein
VIVISAYASVDQDKAKVDGFQVISLAPRFSEVSANELVIPKTVSTV